MRRITVLTLLVSWIAPSVALHCLVLSPGRGLVSHKCANRKAVGCRIRVERESISWYDLSRRHDKHLACVLEGEFEGGRRSGCVKKPSGTVRCWCYGQSNCNSAEKSRRLLEAFVSGDPERLALEVDDIDTEDPVDYASEEGTVPTVSTVTTARPTEKAPLKAVEKRQEGASSTTKAPVAIEIKTQDSSEVISVEYLPVVTNAPPVLPTRTSSEKEVHALPTDPPNVFDTYSMMESAAEYDMESETRSPDGHYKVNVVKIRSKEPSVPLEENHGSRATVALGASLVLLCHFLF
uniref:Secreted protein n=1 Tax=Steinernema glaseri TaxID=37863 RepID=A0A1I8A5Z7_9BILA